MESWHSALDYTQIYAFDLLYIRQESHISISNQIFPSSPGSHVQLPTQSNHLHLQYSGPIQIYRSKNWGPEPLSITPIPITSPIQECQLSSISLLKPKPWGHLWIPLTFTVHSWVLSVMPSLESPIPTVLSPIYMNLSGVLYHHVSLSDSNGLLTESSVIVLPPECLLLKPYVGPFIQILSLLCSETPFYFLPHPP